jgi:hypothetical protein
MTTHEIATVGCKILAVLYFVNAVVALPYSVIPVLPLLASSPAADLPLKGLFFSGLVMGLIYLLIGMVIWRMAAPIARRIAPAEK